MSPRSRPAWGRVCLWQPLLYGPLVQLWLGWGRQRRNPNTGNSGKTRKKTQVCFGGLCVTHSDEPEGSSFHWQWHQKVLWTSSALELSPCPPSSGLAAREDAPMVFPNVPWLCEVPQVQRLSRVNDTEGLNKLRTHLQKQQSKENAKRKTNKNKKKKSQKNKSETLGSN